MEAIFTLFGSGAVKLLAAIAALAVAAGKFIYFIRKSERKLVDSSTNRIEDVKIDDAASVKKAVGSLYKHDGQTAEDAKSRQ